jgi:hypothetical protein
VSPIPTTPRQLFAAVLALAVAAGCGRDVSTDDLVAQANSTNIERLASLYTGYQSEHEWVGPPDEAAFKAYVRAFDPQKLKRIGIDPAAAESLFASDRDGQPFKIRYAVRGSVMGSSEPVIFESTGVDGQRQVAFLDMTEREVDDAEYQLLWKQRAQPTAARQN